MNRANIHIPKLNTSTLTEEQNIKYEAMLNKLADLGIHIRVYSNSSQNIQHPDNMHTYRKDAREAQRLLENNQELPQDLLDRLAYYKPIIEQQLQERK